MIRKKELSFEFDKDYIPLLNTIVLGILSMVVIIYTDIFDLVLNEELFLVFHTLLEILSVLVALSIFLALYNIYDFNDKLKNIIYANTFFIVGLLDIFHLLSYNGMPDFITPNTVQKPTAYWIFSRLLLALGILVANLISEDTKTKINKKIFTVVSAVVTIILVFVIAYDTAIVPDLFIEGLGLTSTKIGLEYLIISLFILSIIALMFKDNKFVSNNLKVSMFSALMLSIFSESIFTLYNDVHDGINFLGHVFKVMSYFIIFKVLFIENIKVPYMKVSKMKEELKEYVDKLEDVVKEKTDEMTIANYKLKDMNSQMINELESAKQIQMALIPKKTEKYLGIEFQSDYIPCGKLSGDFYKYFKIDDSHIGMFLIDVSGHGVSSAMLTIFSDRVLTPFDDEEDKEFYLNPANVLKNFYEVFNDSDFPDETHVVMLYGLLNLDTNEFIYSSAGHNCSPIHIKENGDINILELIDGFPICKLGDIYQPEFRNEIIKLDDGDRILFYTDGVIEVQNEENILYGSERLISLVKKKNHLISREILNNVTNDINRFRGNSEIEDDITMFIIDTKENRV
ncbi:SpoIIE family protein phosphatase [Clostridium sp. D2Q-14]|uniref:MASE3 domain-containing protein n=1 Tax=Anaeromonas gelatinilytica TaxID=2683194 RepID=UPI00193B574B|nr:MASE3 domain-containing protein [Anaeromonas gelatinilytica]MBS4534133.1 SpoIIE family protein phosphatase [Anaeromonas gelatinilytica]